MGATDDAGGSSMTARRLTSRQAAIIGAYTGVLAGPFSDMQAYIAGLLQRPVFSHELADDAFCDRIKELAKPDFLALCAEGQA